MRIVSKEQAELYVVFDFSCIAYKAYFSHNDNKERFVIERVLKHLAHLPNINTAVFFAQDGDFLTKKIIHPDYKGNRPKLPINPKEEYSKYLSFIKSYVLKNESEEADDVICSFVKNNPDKSIIVITVDSDLSHLNSIPNTIVVNEKDMKVLESEKYFKNASINEKHLALFKSTFGDSSDNVKPIFPRLPKKKFHNALWMYSHDHKAYLNEVMSVIKKEKFNLSADEELKIRANFQKNLELVTPRFNIKYEEYALDEEYEFSSDCLDFMFLNDFLKNEKASVYRLI